MERASVSVRNTGSSRKFRSCICTATFRSWMKTRCPVTHNCDSYVAQTIVHEGIGGAARPASQVDSRLDKQPPEAAAQLGPFTMCQRTDRGSSQKPMDRAFPFPGFEFHPPP